VHIAQRVHDSAALHDTRARREIQPHHIIEHHQADTVALRDRGRAQHQRRVDGVVELREPPGHRRHHAASVEHQQDALAALLLVVPHRQPLVARRGLPVDLARIVTGDVIPQALELAAPHHGADALRPGLSQQSRAVLQVVLREVHIARIHPDRRRARPLGLPREKPPRTAPAQVDIAKRELAPARCRHRVEERHPRSGCCPKDDPLTIRHEIDGAVIGGNAAHIPPAAVLDAEQHMVLLARAQPRRQCARRRQVAPADRPHAVGDR